MIRRDGPPRIAICSIFLAIGGAEALTVELAHTFVGRACEVGIFLTNTSKGVFASRLPNGVSIFAPETCGDVLGALIEFDPDAVIFNNFPKAKEFLARAKRPPKFTASMIHGAGRWAMNMLPTSGVDEVWAVSPHAAEFVQSERPGQFVGIIENPVDLELFRPQERQPGDLARFGWPEDSMVFGFLGRIAERKRVPEIVKMFAEVHQELPEARLLIVGGPDPNLPDDHFTKRDGAFKDFVSTIKRLGLTEKVAVTGAVSDPWNWFRLFDLLLLASDFEGAPLCLIEAMACGVPIVAAESRGVVNVLCEGGGLTIPKAGERFTSAEKGKFIEAMLLLASDWRTRKIVGARGRKIAEHRYDSKRFRREVIGLVEARLKPDISDDLTVFVLTVGEPTLAACLASLENQDCRFRLEIIRNVAPMSAAIQKMSDDCRTEFYIQVDADMILDRNAIRLLYEGMRKSGPKVAIRCLKLRDESLGHAVDGIKIFRNSIVKLFPINRQAFSCEIEQGRRIREGGYKTTYSCATLGATNVGFTSEAAFEKYRRDMQKHVRMDRKEPALKLVETFVKKALAGDEAAGAALLGMVAAIVGRPDPDGEKDYRDPRPFEMYARLREALEV